MQSNRKLSKEDTWRPADLKRYIREEGAGDAYTRRRDGTERKHRGGESTERRHRDPEKEPKKERDRPRDSTRERRYEDEKYRHAERRTEGSRDRRDDKKKDRGDDRERREREKMVGGKRDDDLYKRREREHERDKEKHRDKEKERERDRERPKEDRDKRREERDKERRGEERDRERHKEDRDKRREERDKERRGEERDRERHKEDRDKRREERDKERRGEERDRERHKEDRDKRREERDKERRGEERDRERHKEDRDKRREERDKERRREERDREQRTDRERRRHEASGEAERDQKEKHERENRERHGERERHRDEHGDRKEERGHREERERRHKERGYPDDKRKHNSESREFQDQKGSSDEVRRHHGDREQAGRDKQKERRHREEEEPERNHHKDRTSSKRRTSDTEDVEMVTNLQVADDDNLVDQEYEDEFEEYEEDFEEMDESANEGEDEKETQHSEASEELSAQRRKEIEAIQRAMDEENERVGTAQSTSREEEERPKESREPEKNQSRASQRGKFIDFVAAKQREVSKKVATKQKKRSTELFRLIELDFSMTASLLDLPPVNEYNMYIRTFGAANTKQAYVQCKEDNTDRDIQTEDIEVCEKWTQHPSEHSGACGDPNRSQEARDRSEICFDSQRLTAFLRSASQVMVVLLEEDRAERKSLLKLRSQTDTASFSDGSLQLNTKLPFLYGRPISLVLFSQVQRHTMMSVHSPTTKPSAVRLDSCTVICIWNIWEPSRPQKVLLSESEVQCCCFSPGKASLVFAGTSVGSVVLWDLRERATDHYRLKIGEVEWTFRQPTFSTDAVMADSSHFSSVTAVEVVPSTVAGALRPEVPLLASEEESSGLSFQLASLDEIGVLNFWVVVELPKANEAGSPTDLRLRPGGKVKLLHSSRLLLTAERVSPRDAVKTGLLQTLHLKFLPTDSNHFFIGTNMGVVNHETSHSLKAPPKFYSFQDAGLRPVDVTSIHFSPFRQNLFLVGCGDGSIRLHAVSHEHPVAEWKNSTAGDAVVSLQWAQTRPTVFCVLDAASKLHIWDLLKNDAEPVVTERMDSDRVTAMAVCGHSGQQNTYSGVALAHESGKIQMQYFMRHFTIPVIAEEDKLESMMTEAF